MTFSEMYQQLWATGDQQLSEKIFEKDITYTFNAIKIRGRDTAMAHISERKNDFKVTYEIFNICANHELEYHQWKAQAALRDKFDEFLPTNKEFSYAGLTLLKIKNKMITEIIMYSDIDEVLGKMTKNKTSS